MKDNAKLKSFLRVVKYTLIAASAGIIQIGTFTLMNEVFHWNYWLSYTIALVLSVIWNFTFNRKYTFKSANNVPIAMLLVLAYYAVFTPASLILEDVLTEGAIVHVGLHWNEYLVTAINMILNFVTEFLYQRYIVFGKSMDTNDIAKKDKNKKAKSKKSKAKKQWLDDRKVSIIITVAISIANLSVLLLFCRCLYGA